MSLRIVICCLKFSLTLLWVHQACAQTVNHAQCGTRHLTLKHHNYPNKVSTWDEDLHLPVVFHILSPDDQIVTEEQIISQLEATNLHLQQSGDYQNGVTIPLKLELARKDPQGNYTSGIINYTVASESFGINFDQPFDSPLNSAMKFDSLGGADGWNSEYYLNIWVCNLPAGIKGFATFPDQYGPAYDGIVMDPTFFGTIESGTTYPTYSGGKSFTHELGHWLGLRHLWGDEGCTSDDGISDTPNQDSYYFGCPSFKTSCDSEDMLNNFMQYTDDTCIEIFTQGQQDFMYSELFNSNQRNSFMFGKMGTVSGVIVNQSTNTTLLEIVSGDQVVDSILISSETKIVSNYLSKGNYELRCENALLTIKKNDEVITNLFTLNQGEQFSDLEIIVEDLPSISGNLQFNNTDPILYDCFLFFNGIQIDSLLGVQSDFAFTNLEPGEYYLQFEVDPYIFDENNALLTHEFGYGSTSLITLTNEAIDIGSINIEEQQILSLEGITLSSYSEKGSHILIWSASEFPSTYSIEVWDPAIESFIQIDQTVSSSYTLDNAQFKSDELTIRIKSQSGEISNIISLRKLIQSILPKKIGIAYGSEIEIDLGSEGCTVHCFNSNGQFLRSLHLKSSSTFFFRPKEKGLITLRSYCGGQENNQIILVY